MVSFSNFYFHFLANFQTETSLRMFFIFTHVMKPVRDTNSEPGLPVFQDHDSAVTCHESHDFYFFSRQDAQQGHPTSIFGKYLFEI